MDTTYLAVGDDTKIEAQVLDAATTEVILTTRYRQCVVLNFTTPRDGQRFADAIWRAEKRGEAERPEPSKVDDEPFAGHVDHDALYEDAF